MRDHNYPPSPPATRGWRSRLSNITQGIRRVLPFAAASAVAMLGVLLYTLAFPPPEPRTAEELESQMAAVMASATPAPPYSSQVYQIILPSLVYIQTERIGSDNASGFGVGSGVVVNENADILTAYHVVADATEITIIYADGTQALGEIVAVDAPNDIAVLQASRPPEVIVPAVLGSSGAMRVGDQAFAVGNPLGLAGSLSAGVISGFDRTLPFNDSGETLEGLIQFDAAVNPGNSGGPLLNRSGQVVGIVTALANPNEQNSFTGIGFAVPIETAVSAAGTPRY